MLLAFQNHQKVTQAQNPKNQIFKHLPKVELHVHAEGGTLDQETLKYLAQKNRLPEPYDLFSPDDNRNLAYNAPDFGHFLSVYDQATSYIQSPQDVQEVIYRYLKRCHLEGAVYIELTCSPDHVQKFRKTYLDVQAELAGELGAKEAAKPSASLEESMSYASFVEAVVAGINQANEEFGIEARILMVLLRHNGSEAAMKTLDDMIAYPHPYVVGINLAGDEEKFPPELFVDCYAKAKEHGLKLTAHVGEHAGPDKIEEAVIKMKLDRVGHGVTAIQSPGVMQFLKINKTPLELCPSSNLSLELFPSLDEHPLKTFLESGISFSINSDDPTFFGSSLGQEYAKVQAHWGLSDAQMLEISTNAIRASFAEETLKDQLLAQVVLYEQFHKLKKLLEPYIKNIIYQHLLSYEADPTVQLALVLNNGIQEDFEDDEIKFQAQAFMMANRAFHAAKTLHKATIGERMVAFAEAGSKTPVSETKKVALGN
ncbi:MAG: adenosine deaminase [Candidatus Berkiella sp.]